MDVAISEWVSKNLHGNDIINHIMFFITEIGIGYIFWLLFILGILIYHLITKKKFSINVGLFLVFLLLSYLLGECGLKLIFRRTRPYYSIMEFQSFMAQYHYSLPSGYSFPSGHTFSAFTVAISITLYNKKLGFILIPFATLVGFSRIFIGAHFFSDVLAGAILGTLLGIGHFYTSKYINAKRKDLKYLCD